MAMTIAATDVVVRDGSTVCLRQADEKDVKGLLQFLQSLSQQSLYLPVSRPPTSHGDRIRTLIGADGSPALTLVAESGGRIVAFAGYHRDLPRRRLEPKWRSRFPTPFKVTASAHDCSSNSRNRTRGWHPDIRRLRARRQPPDARGVSQFRLHGDDDRRERTSATSSCRSSVTDHFAEEAAARSQSAAAASMRAFFEPRVVAVVGANRTRGKIGSEILHNLVAAGFTGTIVPVHPTAPARSQGSQPTAASSTSPARSISPSSSFRQTKSSRPLTIASARTSGRSASSVPASVNAAPRGGRAKRFCVERFRQAGCRLIGPNCMGLLNTDPAVRLNATFSPVYPPAGSVAMSTQSGALGLAILDYAKRLDIGISSFVSVGNKADVSGNDLIQVLGRRSRRRPSSCSISRASGTRRSSARSPAASAGTKPIVAVKAGRSTAGSRAAASHTGALASNDIIVDALFRQAGVIRTERLEETVRRRSAALASADSAGSRVAILTNAGGPGILAADACEANGLQLPPLSEDTRAELRSFLPAAASVNNPVDMLASAPAEHYRRSLAALLRDDAWIASSRSSFHRSSQILGGCNSHSAGARGSKARRFSASSCGPKVRRRHSRRSRPTHSPNRRRSRWRVSRPMANGAETSRSSARRGQIQSPARSGESSTAP